MNRRDAILETRRLRLRELEDSDLARLHEICSDPRVMRFVDELKPYTRDQTERILRQARSRYEERGLGPWAFIDKINDVLAGYGGLEELPSRVIPEVTYIFAPEYWGKGLATEVGRACLRLGFERFGFERIGASVDSSNRASIRVLEKLGLCAVREGVDEFGLPAVFFEISRGDWARAVPESL